MELVLQAYHNWLENTENEGTTSDSRFEKRLMVAVEKLRPRKSLNPFKSKELRQVSEFALLQLIQSMIYLEKANLALDQLMENDDLVTALSKQTDYQECFRFMRLSLTHWTDNPVILAMQANLLRVNGSIDAALVLYDEACASVSAIRAVLARGIYFDWLDMLICSPLGLTLEGDLLEQNTLSTCTFMRCMLLSLTNQHDSAAPLLQKFGFRYRVHPSVWKTAASCIHGHTPNAQSLSNIICWKGAVVPPLLSRSLKECFKPSSEYWLETNYANNGYFSFWTGLKEETNIVDRLIQRHLLPMLSKTMDTSAIVGAEWWVHTREMKGDIGHRLHFDTDETGVERNGTIFHPLVSSVLYLDGFDHAHAGATVVFDQNVESKQMSQNAWLCSPSNGSFMCFPGNLLHGVFPTAPHTCESRQNRLTLMVGFWHIDVGHTRRLYGPCGFIPRRTRQHTWIDALHVNLPLEDASTVEGQALQQVTPAWEKLQQRETDEFYAIPKELNQRFYCTNPEDFKNQLLFNQ